MERPATRATAPFVHAPTSVTLPVADCYSRRGAGSSLYPLSPRRHPAPRVTPRPIAGMPRSLRVSPAAVTPRNRARDSRVRLGLDEHRLPGELTCKQFVLERQRDRGHDVLNVTPQSTSERRGCLHPACGRVQAGTRVASTDKRVRRPRSLGGFAQIPTLLLRRSGEWDAQAEHWVSRRIPVLFFSVG
jgi:hypothetical protein